MARKMLQLLHLVALVDQVTQGRSPAKGEVLSSRRSCGMGWQPDRSRLCILRMWDILYDPFPGTARSRGEARQLQRTGRTYEHLQSGRATHLDRLVFGDVLFL